MIKVSAFRWIPPYAQGFARDISVRWALEELNLKYETFLVGSEELNSEDYKKLQPFSQVPAYEENGVSLFESGAIILHIAEKSNVLLPSDPKLKAQVHSWMFAAMNTIDPQVKSFEQIEYFTPDAEWAKLRRPAVIEGARKRLLQLATALEGRDYLIGPFSAADITMAMSLRNLGPCDLFLQIPVLVDYLKRCESRPAFVRAMAAHMATYAGGPPA